MLKRIAVTLASTLAAGAVLFLPRPLSGQSVETIRSSEYGTTVRFRNDDGALVERFTSSGPLGYTSDTVLDDVGDVERELVRYRDGRTLTVHLAYGRPGPDGNKRLFAVARNMDREKLDRFLSRLPPPPATSNETLRALFRGRPRPASEPALDSGHPWGHNWHEAAGDSTRTVFRLLHQEIEVDFERLGDGFWRVSDSHGGLRHDVFASTAYLEQDCNVREKGAEQLEQRSPWSCDQVPYDAVGSYDAAGRIVHVVTNDEGYPTETWYGETLVARYHYAHVDGVVARPPHGGLGEFWLELIDARTGRPLLDSRALPITSSKPAL